MSEDDIIVRMLGFKVATTKANFDERVAEYGLTYDKLVAEYPQCFDDDGVLLWNWSEVYLEAFVAEREAAINEWKGG